MLVQKKTYKAILKGLEHYRKQHEEDRKENPGLIPQGWGSSLRSMIATKCYENHDKMSKELPDLMLEYLVDKGFLIPYHGDYTFPGEKLPTKEELTRSRNFHEYFELVNKRRTNP